MSYLEAEGTLIGANMKKGGKMVLQIEVTSDLQSKEDYYHLRKMIERNIRFSLDSLVVSYNVQIDARTERPIKSYRVDESGVVHEVRPEGEQVEMDLGVPKESQPVVDVPEEIDRKIVDEFAISSLAPQFVDLPYLIPEWIHRMVEYGDSYIRLANEYGMSSGKIAELIDEYRARIAPLAKKWDEWRKSKIEQQKEPVQESTVDDSEDEEPRLTDDFEISDDEQTDGEECSQEEEAQEELEGRESDASDEQPKMEPVDLDTYILTKKPSFSDIPYDFPALLARKKSGETWMQISSSLGITSGQLSSAWSLYKKRVNEQRGNGAA